jgi:hypothetical protein
MRTTSRIAGKWFAIIIIHKKKSKIIVGVASTAKKCPYPAFFASKNTPT